MVLFSVNVLIPFRCMKASHSQVMSSPLCTSLHSVYFPSVPTLLPVNVFSAGLVSSWHVFVPAWDSKIFWILLSYPFISGMSTLNQTRLPVIGCDVNEKLSPTPLQQIPPLSPIPTSPFLQIQLTLRSFHLQIRRLKFHQLQTLKMKILSPLLES